MSLTLKDRVAVVTGASRGIGRGIAVELARRGAHVVVNYAQSSTAAAEAVAEIEALGTGARAIAVQADVTQPAEIDRLFEAAVAAFARVDIAVSNSGIDSFEKPEDVTPERFDRVFGLNTRAQFFVAVAAFKAMQAHPSPYRRSIVLTSSVSARLTGVRNHALYAGSKSAVEAITRCLATDFGPHGITVNAIAPGGIKTDLFAASAPNYLRAPDAVAAALTPDRIEAIAAAASPLGRLGLPRDIGNVVAWLAGDDSEWITGQVILPTGGAAM